jgi:hypothetical protein
MIFGKQIKKITMWDMAMTKVAVAAFILFLLRIWPGFMNWLHRTNAWWFFVIAIIFVAIVQYRLWKK